TVVTRTATTTSRETNIAYYDAAHAVVTTVVGASAPIGVAREDWGRRYTETYTVPSGTTFSIVSGDLTPSAAPLTLHRERLNETGQVVAVDDYYDFTSASYSVSSATIGTAWSFALPGTAANYDHGEYAYDKRGRLERVLSPNSTINRTVYDGLG